MKDLRYLYSENRHVHHANRFFLTCNFKGYEYHICPSPEDSKRCLLDVRLTLTERR